jgi:RNA polymerase sigma factor (sigma-70 family)
VNPVLLQRQRRPERAFERLYRAHVHEVYRYALAVTGSRADAEDVVQTTFMNAYRALDRGDQPQKPRNWLIAIAHNVCRERFRQAARRPTEVVFDEDLAAALVPDEAPSATDIQRALGQLALTQREALVMRELEGRSYAEIAEVLGLTVSAVETLLFRARRALREQLEGTLTCSQAEAALSLQLDGRLPRSDAGQLRAHLRSCEACSHLARRQRAQRKGLKALAAVPLPAGLAHWGGSGAVGPASAAASGAGALGMGAAAGAGAGGAGVAGLTAGVALKAAAMTAAVAVAGGGSYAVVRHETASKPARTTVGTTVPAGSSAKGRSAGAHARTAVHNASRQHVPVAGAKRRSGNHPAAPAARSVHAPKPPTGTGTPRRSSNGQGIGASTGTKPTTPASAHAKAKTKAAAATHKKKKKLHRRRHVHVPPVRKSCEIVTVAGLPACANPHAARQGTATTP